MARGKPAPKAKTVRLDLRGVETKVVVEDGEYLVKVNEVTQEEGQAADYFKWVFETISPVEGAKLYFNTSLAPQSLWNLKSLLEAVGIEIPDEPFDIDLNDLVDLQLMVSVEQEVYQGKKQSKVVDFWPAAADEQATEAEVEPEPEPKATEKATPKAAPAAAPKAAAGKKGKEQVTASADEVNEMSQEELDDLITNADLDVDISEVKTLRKMRAMVIDALTEEGKLSE